MGHLQVQVPQELINEVKKTAIDQETNMKTFVEKALREKLELERSKAEAEECRQSTNQTQDIQNEGE